jgi:hypothetical protein
LTTFAESEAGKAVIFEFSELGGGGGGDAGGGDAGGGGEAGGGDAGGGEAGGGEAGGGGGVVPVCATVTVIGTWMRRETPGPDSHT